MKLLSPWLLATALVVLSATGVGGYVFGTKHEARSTALVEAQLLELRTMYEAAAELKVIDNQVKEAEAREANAKEMARVKESLSAATDRAARLERMLSARQATPRACAGGGPADSDQSGADAPAGEPGGDREVGDAIAAVFGACLRDAGRLSALQAEILRQPRSAAP